MYKRISVIAILGLSIALTVTSCNAGRFYDDTYSETKRLELGNVQKEISEGMAQDQVAMILGSPNIVTSDKDKKRRGFMTR